MVRDCVEAVMASLAELEREHERGQQAFYYEVRNERFNVQRRERPVSRPSSPRCSCT